MIAYVFELVDDLEKMSDLEMFTIALGKHKKKYFLITQQMHNLRKISIIIKIQNA